MKALVVHPGPNFSVADVSRGITRGLAACGVDAHESNFDRRLNFYVDAHIRCGDTCEPAFDHQQAIYMANNSLRAEIYNFWPDVVVVVSGFYVSPETYKVLRSRGHRLVLWLTESPYEDDRQLPKAAAADIVILNDPTNLAVFRGANPNTYYLPHSYDPTVHHPRPAVAELKSDFCFVGTGYQSRIDFLEQVDWFGVDVALGGNWQALTDDSPLRPFLMHPTDECIENDQTALAYASTKCSANLYRKEATATAKGWAMGPREVELAACGTFFLREPRGEGDEVLSMLPTFTEPGEFGDLLRWWVQADSRREEVVRSARAAVADRTFEATAKRLLNLLP